MQNPISKLIPFIGGEFPRHFNELIDKVSIHENIPEEELKAVSYTHLTLPTTLTV